MGHIELRFEMIVNYNDSDRLAAALRMIADQIENGQNGRQIIQDGLQGQWSCCDPYEID